MELVGEHLSTMSMEVVQGCEVLSLTSNGGCLLRVT